MVTEVDEQVERIVCKLKRAIHLFGHKSCRLFRRNLPQPFGSESHQFRLNPPLALAEIKAFETRFEVTLPLGYRTFLQKVGNGGAGPAYGMLPLDEAVAYQRSEVFSDILKTPFPHIGSYCPQDWDSFNDELNRKVQRGDITEAEAEQIFDRMMEYETAGTLVLCDEGCGYLHRLVVSGPAHGEMWIDGTCSDQGYLSLQVSFLDWYERWLDQVIDGKRGTWWFNPQ